MSFWNSNALRKRLPELISDYDEQNVVTGSYELGMGAEAYVTGERKKTRLGAGGQVLIPPGQFALLLSEESVRIPLDAIGFISIKSKFKMWGLTNVSGFHVDPGFQGKLIFSVFNAGVRDIVISRGKRIFLLWLSAMDEPAEGYDGPRSGQASIPDEDMMNIRGEIPSLIVLSKKINRLQSKVTMYTSLAGVLIGLAIAMVALLIVPSSLQLKQDLPGKASTPTPTVAPSPSSASLSAAPTLSSGSTIAQTLYRPHPPLLRL